MEEFLNFEFINFINFEFSIVFVSLIASKVLSLEKTQINLVICSLIRTFAAGLSRGAR